MKAKPSSPFLLRQLTTISLVILGLGGMAPISRAQSFIEPSQLPPGGRSSSYLDTSNTLQHKLGSLIVGDSSDELCLNAPASGVRTAYCVSDWSTLFSVIGAPFVQTNQLVTITNPSSPGLVANCALDPQSYSCLAQLGYAYVRGNCVPVPPATTCTPLETYITTANYTAPALGTTTALYGTDQGDRTSYAAYFNGSVKIDRDVDLAGGPGILGQLCLNSTATYDSTEPLPRYGCISGWADLAIGVVTLPYVKLNGVMQPQAARVTKAFQFGSLVAGGVSTSPEPLLYCGDGLCSPQVGETTASCTTDCGNPPPPPNGCFTAATPVDTPRGPIAIAKLRVGDQVYAFDETTHQQVISTVIKLLIHPSKPYGLVTLGDGTSLEVTSVHRFYEPTTRSWRPNGTMTLGERVLRTQGGVTYNVPIRGMEFNTGVATVYNLTIKDFHTYYVKGVLVHNVKNDGGEGNVTGP